MDRDYVEVKLTFEKGVNKYLEPSTLPPGYGKSVQNWIPEATGGLRSRVGWKAATVDSLDSSGLPNMGIDRWAGNVFIATKSADAINIAFHDEVDLSTGQWTNLETVTKAPGVYPVAFASGLDNIFYTHPNFDEIRAWPGTGSVAEVSGSPAGQCIAFHKARIFTAGTLSNPTRLWFSEIEDETSWPATNFFEIGQGDGEPVLEIVSFVDFLLIVKETSVWFLTGAGADTFKVLQIPSVSGASPGRSIVKSPFGAFIIGPGHIYVTDGQSIDRVSTPLGDGYDIVGDWAYGAFVYETLFVTDEATGDVWCYNPRVGSWWKETVANADVPITLSGKHKDILLAGTATGAVPLLYRDLRDDPRDPDWCGTMEYVAESSDVWPAGPVGRVTPRWLFVTVRQRDAGDITANTGLEIDVFYNGESSAETVINIPPEVDAGVYRYRWDLGARQGISAVRFDFIQTLGSSDTWNLDVEAATLGLYVEKIR